MSQGFLKIRNDYLQKAWERGPAELAVCLPAELAEGRLVFQAFGERCTLTKDEIMLGGESNTGPEGLLIALYASMVPKVPVKVHPLRSFKELPHSMPYQAAFAVNAERILVPYVSQIQLHQERLLAAFAGQVNEDAGSGDFSFTLFPLPRVPLYYIFHLPDEEFPAAATCLFAANASQFLPVDGLADVAEHTGKRMIRIAGGRYNWKCLTNKASRGLL